MLPMSADEELAKRMFELGAAGPCDSCGAPTRERGNGEANFCHLCDPVRKLGASALATVLRAREEIRVLSIDNEADVNTRLSVRALVYWDVLEQAHVLGLLAPKEGA